MLSPEQLAAHEAAHAVVALALGCRVTRVTIDPRDPHCRVRYAEGDDRLKEIVQAAGMLGERQWLVEHGYWQPEWQLTDSDEYAATSPAARRVATRLLRENEQAWRDLRRQLLRRRTLIMPLLRTDEPSLR